jgi:L-threonylcarbamoyladenylate synthase
LEALCRDIPPSAYLLCERFWPGPLTLVLKSAGVAAEEVSPGLDTVSVRSPDHPIARALIDASGVPIAAPSANLSGGPSPTEAQHVWNDLSGKIEAIIDGGSCSVGVESTVLDLTSDPPKILRPGGITLAQIREVCPDAVYDKAVFKEVASGEKVRSPGMKYRHYAPRAKVVILRGDIGDVAGYVRRDSENYRSAAVLCYDEELSLFPNMNAISYGPELRHDILARNLYSALRRLDQSGAEIIYARCPEGSDTAAAVENRLKRAAAHNIIDCTVHSGKT